MGINMFGNYLMNLMKSRLAIAAIITFFLMAILTGCARQPTLGEQMVGEAAELRQAGEAWSRGQEMITEGRKKINRGQAMIEEGEELIEEGEEMVEEGQEQVKKSEKLYQTYKAKEGS